MTNPYGNFQMPNFQGMPQFQQGGDPQAFGQGVRQWAQGLGNQFRGMMPQAGAGGYQAPQAPNFQSMAGGYQNRLLNQGGGMWNRFRGGGGPGQGGGGYGP